MSAKIWESDELSKEEQHELLLWHEWHDKMMWEEFNALPLEEQEVLSHNFHEEEL